MSCQLAVNALLFILLLCGFCHRNWAWWYLQITQVWC